MIRCLLYMLLIRSLSSVHAYHLQSRESTRDFDDPFIYCEGAGPLHVEGLPETYPEDEYEHNINLCSVAHGVPGHNVGCACYQAGGNVQCREELANPTLWSASYRSMDQAEVDDAMDRGFSDGVQPFPEYCWDNCLCGNAETASQRLSNSSLALSMMHRYRVVGELARQRAGTITFNYATGGATVTTGGTTNRANTPSDPIVHTQCGNNCTSNNDCTAPASPTGTGGAAEKGSNCTCRAQSSQYQPGSGTVAYVAACLIDMATGGKREEHLPCPCNSTYVSHGCCGSKDGWVWEAPEQKLGELVR